MHQITVIGLGAGDLEQLSVGTYRSLKEASMIMARTEQHPVISELRSEGIKIESFDEIYEQHDAFHVVYEKIVEALITVSESQPVTYVVPGHPLVAEQTIQLLIEKEKQGHVELDIVGGNSFLDPIFAALRIDPIEGFQLLDGTDFSKDDVKMRQHILIGQVYDAFVASEVKLSLMEKYPYDHPVTIVTAAGSRDEKLTTIPLFELDRETEINNLTTVYVPPVEAREERLKEWATFREIIAKLRSPEGCPWDREQTHVTLKKYLIEEAHELLEAIEHEDDEGMIEELGDILLQVFLHAQIGEDDGYFTIEDVLHSIGDKMIRRHPHVFGDGEVENAEQVVQNWQEIKASETGERQSLLEGQERYASSLLTSFNYQKEAAKVGFDWPNIDGAFEKFEEEWNEFQEEVKMGVKEKQLDELGDVLFTIVNIARFLKLSPEEAMIHANQKFKSRFAYVEQCVQEGKGHFSDYRLDELEQFWQQGKRKENPQ
ncbi:nucleoside triphosphate pyrophosphohydrolase [Sporosarcina pasteurii]|uniref:Nucleoside triphosphate pyrophosphohydrolase/pyrophosphatase MazG n=1 Tax=Sporosarcina pasteurii TaxID=1474 RepID=A0A380BBY6_SPOPA|nr:nucleoside triphosphate pyrophosphohydrolase [Sporosarcina pasteurii]MDS9473285.1 nucleoside triphosphate pyrophosphohydrolase [Sporosarcina pasteurii]QBQ06515.1 nucleoside triphosphate pyrophosphohydrolase [Sporosarcina pasteurii]SUI98276.1 Nucleoside triphosphate pyrophosphohydrolase/pyrophosphatase MazG [Sporosarcina pasteurii]